MIKYLGSKRLLLPSIVETIGALEGVRSVFDVFAGTSRVGHALKKNGYQVFANDHNAYAATLARCYVQSDAEDVVARAEKLIAELMRLPPAPGYFTETFCEKSRFFHPKNGARIDAMREHIASLELEPELESVLLVSLMEAADRVDSTTGVQMAYLKAWAARAHKDIELRLPDVLPCSKHGKGRALKLDAAEAARAVRADVAYLDPPYNQHKYLGNYHVWESLVLWDKPEVYGTACKRVDVRERGSAFNSKRAFFEGFRELLSAIDAKHIVVSFNNEGYASREDMISLLSTRGDVRVTEHDYKRYVGAQIGIYNPEGDKVGKVSHLRNKEFLFVV